MNKLAASIITLSACAYSCTAEPYKYELFIVRDFSPNGLATDTALTGVNNAGKVVGWSRFDDEPTRRGFYWTEDEGFVFLSSPSSPAESVLAMGVSDDDLILASADIAIPGGDPDLVGRVHTYDPGSGSWTQHHPWAGCTSIAQDMSGNGWFCGEIVRLDDNGNCGSAFFNAEGFFGRSGDLTPLGRFGDQPSFAHNINRNGAVCGEAVSANGFDVTGVFREQGGQLVSLPLIGYPYASAQGINDNNTVVGEAATPGFAATVAVKWTRENGVWSVESLDNGFDASYAHDVNNREQVVGWSVDADNPGGFGCIWAQGHIWNLNDLIINPQSGAITQAIDISDSGWIIGRMIVNGDSAFCILKPIDQDSDGDGLLDSWEQEDSGIDINNDGLIDLDLYELGAREDRKDVLVEVDVMQGVPFSMGALDDVKQAFDNAPIENPSGEDGINAILMVSETNIPFDNAWLDLGEIAPVKQLHQGSDDDRASFNWEHIRAARDRSIRYCVFANNLSQGAVGLGETPGNDFVVAQGGYAAVSRRSLAETFMHELGHNLGLRHGGSDGQLYKPNYISVMNYGFRGYRTASRQRLTLDFSREALPTLNESDLNEQALVPGGDNYSGVRVFFGQPDGNGGREVEWLSLGTGMIDWNNDGIFDMSAAADLNWLPNNYPGAVNSQSSGEPLSGHQDWDAIILPIGPDGPYAADAVVMPDYEELTVAELEWLDNDLPDPPGPDCAADLTGDGVLDFFDVSAFLSAYSAQDPAADFTGDGQYDFFDVSAFLSAYSAGCP